ncbi:protein [Lentinula edodes]|uniref:Protein n=1 Tax=Lentinula edodes TaxID=5353 RepID=A0A1Q3EIL1_LENED|nr:protein [Lentinula edodes]
MVTKLVSRLNTFDLSLYTRMLGYVDEQAEKLPFSDMIPTTKVTEAVKTIMRNSMYCLLTTVKDRLTFSSLENVSLSLIEAWESSLTTITELEFVWSPDIFGMFNVLYFLQRYMPFGSLILLLFFDGVVSPPMSFNSNSCMTLYIMSGLTFAIGICGSQVVLIWLFNLVIFISTRTAEGYPGPSVTSVVHCASQRYVQPLFFIFWVLLIVHHAGILLLMLIPQGYSLLRMQRWSDLINLINDIAGALRLPTNLQGLLIPFQHVMETVLTSRAIIHWKRQSQKSQITTALDLTGTSFAEIWFNKPLFAGRTFN